MNKLLTTVLTILCVGQYTPHAQMLHETPCKKGDMGWIEPRANGMGDFYFYPSIAGDKREWLGKKLATQLPQVIVHMEDKK